MPTAAIYARQSFYKEDSCSIDMQIERSKAFCVSQGWDYIIYDIDKGYSGKDTDRPGFKQMMKDISAGKVHFVVVYKLDRISRNLRDFFELMEEFKARDVGFRSLTENFDTTTPMGRAMLAIIAVFAQLERETTAERVRDNMLERAKMGIWNGGPIPFGFLSEKTTVPINGKPKEFSVLAIEETESNWVHDFYNWYLEPKGSIRSNVFKANEKSIPTKTGKAWNPNQMQRILSNPLYCVADQAAWEYFSSLGVQIANDIEEFDGQHGLMWYNRRKAHKKTTRLREHSEWILTIGGHPGTIPGELYVKVQANLAANAERPARAGKSKKALLAYLVKCGKCGKHMAYYDYRQGDWQYYKCRSKVQQGSSVCVGQTVKGNDLENTVINAIKKVCTDHAFLQEIARQAIQNFDTNAQPLLEEMKRLTSRIDEITSEQKELIRALGKRSLPEDLIEDRVNEIEREKAPILKRLSEIEAELESQDWLKIDMEMVFGNLLKFNDVFDGLDFEGKRNFLQSIIKEIIYDEGKIRIVLYFMPEITPDDPNGKGNCSESDPTGNNDSSGTSVMNPCLCGFYGSDLERSCSPLQIKNTWGASADRFWIEWI